MKKLTSENGREFITQVSKIVHEFLAVLKFRKILGNISFSEQIFYRTQSLGASALGAVISGSV